MNKDIEAILRIVIKEVWRRKKLVLFLYVFTSFVFAGFAWIWPQKYTSSSTIVVEDKNIIRPLMEGTAVTTALSEPAKMATQILNGRAVLTSIIQKLNLIEANASVEDVDNLMESMRERTMVSTLGKNILQISFRSSDRLNAYEITKEMTRIFVRESQKIKQRESRAAYEFIDKQVRAYQSKLQKAQEAIKNFRTENIDSTPGAERAANERILELTRQIEELEIEISGENSKLAAQNKQLRGGGGAENTASITRETQLRERVTSLKTQLEDLRLTYKDTYPDIIQLIGQIEATEKKIEEEIEARTNPKSTGQQNKGSQVSRELNSQILLTKTNISTLESRKAQLDILRNKEREKVGRITAVETEIEALTRESQVNQTQYDALLEQRESARISMEMDEANQGIVLRVQEEAFLPVSPEGIRFIHIIIVGFLFSFFVPLGVVFSLAMLDQKLRDPREIIKATDVSILSSVYQVTTQSMVRERTIKLLVAFTIAGLTWSIYAIEVWFRLKG